MRTGFALRSSVFLFALVLVAFASCGGGGSTTPGGHTGEGSGTIAYSVEWPSRSRLVPAAAESIRLRVARGTEEVAAATLVRPAGGGTVSGSIEGVKVGDFTLIAAAHPNADATGAAQATGSVPVTVNDGQTTTIALTMASTIDHLEATPAAASVPVGQTVGLSMVAKDAAGAVVLTWPGKEQWSSANLALVSVDTSGTATGVLPTGASPGPVTVTVTETESGKTATVPVTVTSSTAVSVSPSPAALSVGDALTFAAAVANAPNTGVTWRVLEGAAGGSITGGGVYTAPAARGTYHVIATSQYDNAKEASVVVTVQSGSIGVTIQ